MVDAITNSCIYGMQNEGEPLYPTLHVPDIKGTESNHEISGTGGLSEINFSYNNITFHVYPVLKIANERSRGAVDVRLIEDESDI